MPSHVKEVSMPSFSLISKNFRGNRIVEILKDGEPFWENLPGACKHFSFGLSKATAILSCMPAIRKFVDTNGQYPSSGYYVEMPCPWKPTVFQVSRERNFETTFGQFVQSPYLEIRNQNTDRALKFGMLKAEALLELHHEIATFVVSHRT